MKKIFLYTFLLFSSVLVFQACGGSRYSSAKNDENTSLKSVSLDYLNLAKYHFSIVSKELKKEKTIEAKNNKKFRSYPGATVKTTNSDVMQITAVTPFDKYIESMTIKNGSEKIEIEVKNKLYVIVSHYDGSKLLDKQELTLHDFTHFDMFEGEK